MEGPLDLQAASSRPKPTHLLRKAVARGPALTPASLLPLAVCGGIALGENHAFVLYVALGFWLAGFRKETVIMESST